MKVLSLKKLLSIALNISNFASKSSFLIIFDLIPHISPCIYLKKTNEEGFSKVKKDKVKKDKVKKNITQAGSLEQIYIQPNTIERFLNIFMLFVIISNLVDRTDFFSKITKYSLPLAYK